MRSIFRLSILGFCFTVFAAQALAAPPMTPTPESATSFAKKLAAAALERTQHTVRYDGQYRKIAYPNGDVPSDTGVCTDVVIRSYRLLGIDLQRLVHEDMSRHFQAYPSQRLWKLKQPDSNIDHRRVPNLQTFLTRHGQALPITTAAKDYRPGDIVTWRLPNNLPHIGIVSDRFDRGFPPTPLVVHNIGRGPKLDNALFMFTITGHYRYRPSPHH